MDRDGSVLLFDEDEKDDSDLDELVKRNLLPELDSTYKVQKEYVKVFLRIRPFTKEENEKCENKGCFEIEDDRSVLAHVPKDSHAHRSTAYGLTKQVQKFTFSKVFRDSTSQKVFFDETMLSTVKEFINGENCLVFSYGVTNSGKTYTIQGDPGDGGLLPRSLDVIFNSINSRLYSRMDLKPNMYCDVLRLNPEQEQTEIALKESIMKMTFADDKDICCLTRNSMDSSRALSEDSLNQNEGDNGLDEISTAVANRKREEATIDVKSKNKIRFSVWVSFVEIYNEQMYDLLVPVYKKRFDRRQILQLREDKNGNPYVKDLRQINVTSADEAYRLLALGKRNLKIACTKLNQSSSRSHCIFTIKIIQVVDNDQPHYARVNMLSLCDLAGSERHQKTENAGDRLKEAGNINSSLLTLGRCITILRSNQNSKQTDRNQMVPFRESKLTRLFQTYLTGKGRASMVVNINQSSSMFDETLNSLRYSAVAKQVVVQELLPKPNLLELSKRQDSLLPPKTTVLSRATIGWATPGTYQKMIDAGELSACASTMSPTKEEGEEEDENDDTINGDEEGQTAVTRNDSSYMEDDLEARSERDFLLRVIKQLKEKLQAEVKATEAFERKIRAEVCEEMKKQLVVIENQYQENLRVQEEINEEKLEKKMEILMEAMQKSKKRRLENDDEECVPKHLLEAEAAKVQKCNSHIEDLEDQVKVLSDEVSHLRSSFTVVSKERESLAQEKTKAQFFASDAKQKLDDMQSKLNESNILTVDLGEQIRILTEECESQQLAFDKTTERMQDLEMKNRSLQDSLNDRERQMEELKSELEISQNSLTTSRHVVETDHQQSEEVNRLREKLGLVEEELAKVVIKRDVLLESGKQQQESLVQELQKVTMERDELVESDRRRMEDNLLQAAELKAQIAELERELTDSKNELLVVTQKLNSAREERDVLGKCNSEANQLVSDLNKQIVEVRDELTRSQQEVFCLEEKLTKDFGERDSLKKGKDDTEELNSCLRSPISQLETALEGCHDLLTSSEERLRAVTDKSEMLANEKLRLETLVSDQDSQITELKREISSCHRSLEEAEEEMDAIYNEKKILADEKEVLEGKVSEKETEVQQLKTESSSSKSRVTELEEKCTTLSLEIQQLQELSETQAKISASEGVQESLNETVELRARNERLEEMLEKMTSDSERCSKEKGHFEEELTKAQLLANDAKLKLEKMQNQLDEKSELITDLHDKLRELKSECELHKETAAKEADRVTCLESEVVVLVEQLSRLKKTEGGYTETLQKEKHFLEQKLTGSQEAVKHLEEMLKSAKQQLLNSETTMAELKSQLERKDETILKLSRPSVVKKSRVNSEHGDEEFSRLEFESIINKNQAEKSNASSSRRQTRSTCSRPKLLKPIENLDLLDEADQDDVSNTPRRSNRKTPCLVKKESYDNTLCDLKTDKDSTFKSPPTSPTASKRRRKLFSTIDKQLQATPIEEDEPEVVAASPHTSVIRKLRSRKQ